MTTNKYCQVLAELRNRRAHYLKDVGDQWRTPDLLVWGINAMFGPLVLDLFAATKVAPPVPAEEVTSAAVDLPEVESRIWPLEVGLVFNQVEGADALSEIQQNKLKANINQLWLERMPTSEIITVASEQIGSMQREVA
ncbi:TPA: hypothetical protein KE522_002020 [Citrobacter koseri]|nr:hypothetical protein [Citrobacter koseri]